VQLPGGGVGLPVRRRTQCLALADQAGNVQRRLNMRVTPTVGIPPTPRFRPSSSAVARLSRNQCGIDPGGPIPIFGNADALSRTVPRARGQQRGPRQIHRPHRRAPRLYEGPSRSFGSHWFLGNSAAQGAWLNPSSTGCPGGCGRFPALPPCSVDRFCSCRAVLARRVPDAPSICRSVRIVERS